MSRPTTPVADRFWPKVDPQPNGCWLWTGFINRNGYGYFQTHRGINPQPARRIAWALMGNELTPGRYLGSICGNRACVRPAHHKYKQEHT